MIDYYITSRIWLGIEKYTNSGLSQEQVIETIRRMPDPGSTSVNLRCEVMHINSNVIVETSTTNPNLIEDIVYAIEAALDIGLANMTDRELLTEICHDLANRHLRAEAESYSSQRDPERQQHDALRRLLKAVDELATARTECQHEHALATLKGFAR